jgi:multiple sugar transport system permease protein
MKPNFFRSSRFREALTGYLFISPWVIGLMLFTLGPISAAFGWSFTDYPILSEPKWVGLANYRRILNDPLFYKSLSNTLYFVAIRAPLLLGLAFFLALLLNRRGRIPFFFRAAIYLPAMVPVVALAVAWVVLLDPRLGYVNHYGGLIGLPSVNWLSSRDLIKPVIIFISLWGLGSAMVIFLAGLQGIPSYLYESADLDGAGPLVKLRYITLPMMTPVILFNLIIEVINSFQVFVYAMIMTNGGPANESLFYVLYIYRNAFQFFRMGYASALSVVLFSVVFVLTLILLKTSDRWVVYDRT